MVSLLTFIMLSALGVLNAATVTYQAENASFGGGTFTETKNSGYLGSSNLNFPASGGYNFSLGEAPNSGKHILKNNISFDGNVSIYSSSTQEKNSWNGGFTVSTADFQSLDTSFAKAARKADGSLPDVPFLHLVQGSDLVNAGVNVGLPYNGSAPDLGAFETNY